MNKRGTILWGFVATAILTTLMSGSQGLGLTRMNIPFILGSMFTPDRDRAKAVGFGVHFVNGWLFAAVYAATFESWRRATWWLGACIGLVQAAFFLLASASVLPALHPRMASEQRGPTPTRQLEPPGFLALNYGYRTPLSVVLAHIAYGAVLGAFYRPKSETDRLRACSSPMPRFISGWRNPVSLRLRAPVQSSALRAIRPKT